VEKEGEDDILLGGRGGGGEDGDLSLFLTIIPQCTPFFYFNIYVTYVT